MPLHNAPRDLDGSPDVSRMSIWTVIGAVAASVLTAGILGGASGIMQIPAVINEVSVLQAAREARSAQVTVIDERLRSLELSGENMQRQINALSTHEDAIIGRLEKRDADDRSEQMALQRQITATDSVGKDRVNDLGNTISGLRSAVDALGDRQRLNFEALSAVRQNLYDLSARAYTRGSQQPLPPPEVPQPSPYPSPSPPKKGNGSLLLDPPFHPAGTSKMANMTKGK